MSQYQQLSEKFSALEGREKQLILWVSFGLIVYLFFWFGISPALDDLSTADNFKWQAGNAKAPDGGGESNK